MVVDWCARRAAAGLWRLARGEARQSVILSKRWYWLVATFSARLGFMTVARRKLAATGCCQANVPWSVRSDLAAKLFRE
jgi:hypothetical protein